MVCSRHWVATAYAAVFHFLVGNADAHAKNIALVYTDAGVRLAPLYDVVSTAVYPELSTELALSVGDELDPAAISSIHWSDLAHDFGLRVSAFASARRRLTERVVAESRTLRDEARAGGWHNAGIEAILDVITARAPRVL